MNPDISKLQPYPFEKLRQLKAGITPPKECSAINLSIGEPKHQPPDFVADTLIANLKGLASYPSTRGSLELRLSIANWLTKRYSLAENSLDAERHILPVNGTREALFAFAQCIINRNNKPLVLSPNPFYQIYEGAAFLAGAVPYFLNTTKETGLLPDFDQVSDDVWQRCQLIYLCSPGNPTGAVIKYDTLKKLMDLADKFDFVIASDECYSEIYFDENQPPIGLLEAAQRAGNTDFKRCVVFHSLSKRSNLPGLRSGFVAGDASIIEQFFRYRTYHGCAMAPYIQAASIAAWDDEQHVIANRVLYREKFTQVHEVLRDVMDVTIPEASFYLWPKINGDEELFAKKLFLEQNVTVVPGSYLSRLSDGINPGQQHLRIALVAPLNECIDAAQRIKITAQSF